MLLALDLHRTIRTVTNTRYAAYFWEMPMHRLPSSLFLAAACLTLPMAAIAAAPAVQYHAYRTVAGDTLISIGEDLLRDPADWRRVQRLNRIADPRRIPVGTTLRIPLEMMRFDPVTARVTQVRGQVSSRGSALGEGTVIRSGDEVETADDGSTTIELADGSLLTLQPKSRMRIDTLGVLRGTQQQDASLTLSAGRVESQAAAQRGPAARYRIVTPTAAVGVRGTQFRVGAGDDATRAEVTEGAVAVDGAQASVKLPAGFGVVAAPGGVSKPVELLRAPSIAESARLQERTIVRVPFAPVDGAGAYRAQVALDADFRAIVTQAIFKSNEAKFGDLADGEYHVRVRAIDAAGLEGRDADLAFRLKARPEPPFASFPQHKGKLRADTVGFVWAKAAEAQRYAFQLATDDTFATPLIVRDDLTEPKLALADKLAPADYVWRLRSIRADGNQGPWSDIQRFQLRPPPANPEPAKIDDKSLGFTWPAEPEQSFEFQLARDAEFAKLVESRTLREASITLPKPDAGTYYMRVRATDPDGFVGPWTGTQTIEVPPGKPWWLLLLLIPLI